MPLDADSAVHGALCPRIAVLSSGDVGEIARRNGAQHIAQVLRPFERCVENIAVRTSQLAARTRASFPVRFDALDAFLVPKDLFARGALEHFLDTVQAHLRSHAQQLDGDQPIASLVPPPEPERAAWEKQVRSIPPWCADIAAYLYRYRPICAFDGFSHPTAMLLVVSSSNPDPMNAFAQLYEESSTSSVFRSQPHVEGDVLRSYLVLHDASAPNADLRRSEALLDEVKRTYGLQCALLTINSATEPVDSVVARVQAEWDTPDLRHVPPSSTPPGAALSVDDVQRIEAYVRELVVKSLVPYLERTVQQLNEQVGSSRRGLTGRLLGAGRKLFSTRTTTPSAPPASGWDAERGTYPATALASQTRRLADLAMHTCDYKLAAEMYDTARRDYEQDRAMSYVGASTELLCLARLLSGSSDGVPLLFSSACDAYLLDAAGRLYALRATFLYSDVQRTLDHGAQVAAALRRAAAFTDEVLRGVVLELAALAYLCMPHPHVRKSAATMLQSAEQFDACGQKAFALRCYMLAAPYYEDEHWPAITDRVLTKLAAQAHNSGQGGAALEYAVKLLYTTPRTEKEDKAHVEQLVNVYEFAKTQDEITLPTPLWDVAECTVQPEHDPSGAWAHLYPSLAHALHKKHVSQAGEGEAITVRLQATNPLHTPVTLSDLRLAFADAAKPLDAAHVSVDAPPSIALGPRESRSIDVPVRIAACGTFGLCAIHYRLEGVPVRQAMEKYGKRLQATKAQRITPTYAPDTTLQVHVRQDLPRLTTTVEGPHTAYVGESISLRIAVRSEGAAVSEIQVACKEPYASFGPAGGPVGETTPVPAALATPAPHRVQQALAPQEHTEVQCTVPLLDAGETTIEWLFVYQNAHGETFSCSARHSLDVRTLLRASTSVRTVQGASLAYLVALDVQNEDEEAVTIAGVSMLSTQWKAAHAAEALTLAPGERSTMATRIDRASTPTDATLPHALGAIGPLVGRSDFADVEAAALNLHCTAVQGAGASMPLDAYVAQRSALRMKSLEHDYEFLPEPVRRRAFLLLESHEADLLVHWTRPAAQGCLLLYGTHIGLRADVPGDVARLESLARPTTTTRAMYAATTQEQQRRIERLLMSPLAAIPPPVSLEVHAPVAKYEGESVQLAPVTLRLRNESTWPLAYTLRLLPASIRPAAAQAIAPWIGRTVQRGTLAPWHTETLSAHVAITSAGGGQ
ncbi:uncharacterized protein MJAP1_002071 [Malassezia japonica]|uniref:Uncharacterized protein n=1 Tax=Malassezia japonica TaxID=223818 RepID=A0AAF0EY45_9BASI|nr:uncharacterized protein MJAP1_002071 [Malassezia japonica]WFD39100.1 hypothetical protein MJAP1_002071 [Malassezia japonica]